MKLQWSRKLLCRCSCFLLGSRLAIMLPLEQSQLGCDAIQSGTFEIWLHPAIQLQSAHSTAASLYGGSGGMRQPLPPPLQQTDLSQSRLSILRISAGSAVVSFSIAPPPASAGITAVSAAVAAQTFAIQYATKTSPLRTDPAMVAASDTRLPTSQAVAPCDDGVVRTTCTTIGDSDEGSSKRGSSFIPTWGWIILISGVGVVFMIVVSAIVACRQKAAGRAAQSLKSIGRYNRADTPPNHTQMAATSYNNAPAREVRSGTEAGLAHNPAYGQQADQWHQTPTD